ncbi:hypothetical protein NVP1121O_155 [Vibrio phage 1.121.O._10N.286.46.C4]|nr:hypothetical protein NVP1121O_155 [Vibrio phage 1.121.O._10N.286.46.C4]
MSEDKCRDCDSTGVFYQIEGTPCHCVLDGWIIVNRISQIPEGQYQVLLEGVLFGSRIHTIQRWDKNMGIVAGRFAYNVPKILAYRELPAIPEALLGGEVEC